MPVEPMMWWDFGIDDMDRYRMPPKTWRTTSLKNKMIRKIEDAIMYCSESLPENAGDMERRAFLRCDTKRKYLRDIDRIIDYIDGITMASLIRKQQLERELGEAGTTIKKENMTVVANLEGQLLDSPKLRKRFDSRLKRALRIPDSRIRMSKILKMRSEDYLRKIVRHGSLRNKKLELGSSSSRYLRIVRRRRKRRYSDASSSVQIDDATDEKQPDLSFSDASSLSI